MTGQLILVLGAPGTGKTTTARELTRILCARGVDAVMLPDGLSESAKSSFKPIEAARGEHRIVLADACALMPGERADEARGQPEGGGQTLLDACRQADAIMLMSLDLGWRQAARADGDAGHADDAREQTDTMIRAALQGAGLSYAVVAGHGIARIEHALSLIDHLLDEPARQQRMQEQARAGSSPASRWRWFCDNCDDGECEQHWLPRPQQQQQQQQR